MAARNSIEKGVVALGGGSFVEVKPPVITAPEVLYLAYRGSVSSEFRKSVQTRPANLVAYWPMDEGDGIVARDALGRFDGSLVAGTAWTTGRFGRALSFNGTDGHVSTQATGELLGIDGKNSRTISFWAKANNNNPRSQPGFYGYGDTNCPNGLNKYWGIRNIKDGGYTQLLSQHWCWDPRSNHGTDIRTDWVHFAPLQWVGRIDFRKRRLDFQLDQIPNQYRQWSNFPVRQVAQRVQRILRRRNG